MAGGTGTPGTRGAYCYSVENTGDVTLSHHNLDDGELEPGAGLVLHNTARSTSTSTCASTILKIKPTG